ncbi:hypothetical protein CIPAW_06G129100 [Carya illinoinensis]|uniref:Uncharacterized protein n=1 Tax=Carya illinoinensis TaxID=32201 RepID=A0A8T1QBC8_CARIL|nr:hypothetical protein CIPAW_06G129100 [Carya illinoinensis]
MGLHNTISLNASDHFEFDHLAKRVLGGKRNDPYVIHIRMISGRNS